MAHPVVYDISRLKSRVLNATPNGIDRVDMAFARYFLGERSPRGVGMLFLQPFGHRVISNVAALEAIDTLDEHFGEGSDPDRDPALAAIKSWLRDPGDTGVSAHRLLAPRKRFIGEMLRWARRHGAVPGRPARSGIPPGARFVIVSQFPLAKPGAFEWLRSRPDVRLVCFIHDVLPLEMPEYFRPEEYARHECRLRTLAKYAAGAIVSTQTVKTALIRHLTALGRSDFPVMVSPLPVSPVFFHDEPPDQELSARPFFVQCGTLEPRKNHLLVLHVWKELVARRGAAAPRLVLVGARGWENENIVDLLERSLLLRHHAMEVGGLATPSLNRLLRNARAVLVPSFGEGYGLPLIEAIASGTPAIGSDIGVFREIAGDAYTALSPIDGEGWLREIERLCDAPATERPTSTKCRMPNLRASPDFDAIEAFVQSL